MKPGGGKLTVKAFPSGSDAVIEIADDGAGMDKETMAHIFEHHHVNSAKESVGVYNVQRRLKLYYGEAYGISYESTPGAGTTARVRIPLEKEDRHEEEI